MSAARLTQRLRHLERLAADRREALAANDSREVVLEQIRLIRARRREYALSQMSEEERADFLAAEAREKAEWEALPREERDRRVAEAVARVQRIIEQRHAREAGDDTSR